MQRYESNNKCYSNVCNIPFTAVYFKNIFVHMAQETNKTKLKIVSNDNMKLSTVKPFNQHQILLQNKRPKNTTAT